MADAASGGTRLIFPGLAGLYDALSPYSYAFMRFCTGAVLFPHGWQKVFHGDIAKQSAGIAAHGVPASMLLAYAVTATEFFSAAFLAIGLFTRVAAAMIWIEMAVIGTVWLSANGYFWTSRGYEYALLWLLLCTAIIFRGGGRHSVDRLIGWEF